MDGEPPPPPIAALETEGQTAHAQEEATIARQLAKDRRWKDRDGFFDDICTSIGDFEQILAHTDARTFRKGQYY